MSFWRNFGFYTVSPIENILDRGDYTLETLLNEEEILSEVKAQNKRLLDFLTQNAQLEKMVNFITVPAADDAEANFKLKYPFLACEILASEVWAIVDAIFKTDSLIEQLFNFLDKDPPLHPILSSFVARVTAVLLDRKPQQMIDLMKKHGNMISRFLKHLNSSPVMDLLLKVVTSEDMVESGGVLQWLRDEHLIKSLVEKLSPEMEPEIHENAAQALVDVIRASASKPSPLMDELESQQTVEAILGFALTAVEKGFTNRSAQSALLNGLSVIVELIKRNSRPAFNTETKFEDLAPVFIVSLKHMDKLKAVLTAQDLTAKKIVTSMGESEPVGFVRLKVMELFLALTQSNYECVDTKLVETDVFSMSFDMFFRFHWNNFLHVIVEKMIKTVFAGQNDALKEALVTKAKLVDRILATHTANNEEVTKPKGVRRGYMGHLTVIAGLIQDEGPCSEQLGKALETVSGWQQFVATTLSEMRLTEGRPLGGKSGSMQSNSPPSSDDDDYEDPELDFGGDNDPEADDLNLKDDTQRLDDEDPDKGFDVDQNKHDSDDEAPTGVSEKEVPPTDPTTD